MTLINIITITVLVSLGINILMFVPAFFFKTDKLTDISYAITFIVVGLFGFHHSSQTSVHWTIFILILLWAIRLGTFLLLRVSKRGKDSRFDTIRNQFWAFLKFWVAQGASVFIIMLAAIAGFTQNDTHFALLSWTGIGVFVVGFVLESVADLQKYRFGNDPQNKGRWIDLGVWRISRHPNYLGEMLVWIGMLLLVAPSLSSGLILLAVLSPLYIICLLRFVSGIPPLEKSAKQKWGTKKDFQDYMSQVPLLIPTITSIKRITS